MVERIAIHSWQYEEAIQDGKITREEFSALSPEEQAILVEELGGKIEFSTGDEIILKKKESSTKTEQEEKPGFFKRIWNGIKKFLNKLFPKEEIEIVSDQNNSHIAVEKESGQPYNTERASLSSNVVTEEEISGLSQNAQKSYKENKDMIDDSLNSFLDEFDTISVEPGYNYDNDRYSKNGITTSMGDLLGRLGTHHGFGFSQFDIAAILTKRGIKDTKFLFDDRFKACFREDYKSELVNDIDELHLLQSKVDEVDHHGMELAKYLGTLDEAPENLKMNLDELSKDLDSARKEYDNYTQSLNSKWKEITNGCFTIRELLELYGLNQDKPLLGID